MILEGESAIFISLLVVARISRLQSRQDLACLGGRLHLFHLLLEALMSVLQLNELFAHFVRIAVFLLHFALDLLITLAICQSLLKFGVHPLGHFLELLAFLALHDQLLLQLLILHLHRLDDLVSLLELFFDDFQLLRVGKGVFALYDFFELLAQPGTLLDVHLDLDLYLLLAR